MIGPTLERGAGGFLVAASAVLTTVLAVAALAGPTRAEGTSGDAWEAIRAVREALAAAPRTARFDQTYLPAGFSSGEREGGRVSLDLPACLRWDYETPYAKSFLLCGDTVHAWNAGEESGRRYRIEAAEERGLDLLRLSAGRLERRYDAALASSGEGALEVVLTPREAAGEVARASLTMNPERTQLLGLSIEDVEGNRTRFELSAYAPLPEAGVFSPPAGMEWIAEDAPAP